MAHPGSMSTYRRETLKRAKGTASARSICAMRILLSRWGGFAFCWRAISEPPILSIRALHSHRSAYPREQKCYFTPSAACSQLSAVALLKRSRTGLPDQVSSSCPLIPLDPRMRHSPSFPGTNPLRPTRIDCKRQRRLKSSPAIQRPRMQVGLLCFAMVLTGQPPQRFFSSSDLKADPQPKATRPPLPPTYLPPSPDHLFATSAGQETRKDSPSPPHFLLCFAALSPVPSSEPFFVQTVHCRIKRMAPPAPRRAGGQFCLSPPPKILSHL